MAEPLATDGPSERPATYHKHAQWFAAALIVIITVGLVIQSVVNLSGRQSAETQPVKREPVVQQRQTAQDFLKEADKKMQRLQGKANTPRALIGRRTTEAEAVADETADDPYQAVYEAFQKEEIRRALESRRGGLRPRGSSQKSAKHRARRSTAATPREGGLNRNASQQTLAATDRRQALAAFRERMLGDVHALQASSTGLSPSEDLQANPETPRTASQISDQATVGEPVANRSTGDAPAGPGPGEVLLPTGTVMSGVLDMQLMSDYDGPWRGILVRDVYDVNQTFILFPKGTKIVGKTLRISNVNEPIQARMGLTANWAILPNGNRIDFRLAQALDAAGVAALKGDVNYHVLAQFAGVSAYAVLGVLPSLALDSGAEPFSSQDQALEDLTRRSRDQYRRLANRYLNLVPTITLPSGTPFKLFIEDDLYITPWKRVNDTIYTTGITRADPLAR